MGEVGGNEVMTQLSSLFAFHFPNVCSWDGLAILFFPLRVSCLLEVVLDHMLFLDYFYTSFFQMVNVVS